MRARLLCVGAGAPQRAQGGRGALPRRSAAASPPNRPAAGRFAAPSLACGQRLVAAAGAPQFGFRLTTEPKAGAGRFRAARLPPRHRTAPRRALRCAELCLRPAAGGRQGGRQGGQAQRGRRRLGKRKAKPWGLRFVGGWWLFICRSSGCRGLGSLGRGELRLWPFRVRCRGWRRG